MRGYIARAAMGMALLIGTAIALAQGPQVPVADTAEGGGPMGGVFFVVVAVDGQEERSTALSESHRASYLQGTNMVIRQFTHSVPAGRPVKLTLEGAQDYAAPVQGIFKSLFSGGPMRVKGDVEVTLQPGSRYRVNGVLDSYRREVWIEEAPSGAVVSTKVAMPPDPNLLKAMEGAAYLCCNLRYDNDWISESPQAQLPIVPAGARIKVLDYGRDKANVLIDGRKMRVGIDFARTVITIQRHIEGLSSAEDPRLLIDRWPADVRSAVRSGRVLPGMTREQVRVALGPPRPDLTPSTDRPEWVYIFGDTEEAYVVFDAEGRVKEVDASRKARASMLAPKTQDTAPVAAAPASAASSPK